jgi:hypothetical protein
MSQSSRSKPAAGEDSWLSARGALEGKSQNLPHVGEVELHAARVAAGSTVGAATPGLEPGVGRRLLGYGRYRSAAISR